MSLAWGQSPVDLANEQPLEFKFLEDRALETPGGHDSGALERSSWQVANLICAGLGWTSGVLMVSSVALLLLNAHAFGNWADQHQDAPGADIAHQWHDTAGRYGLNTLVDGVKRAADFMRKAGWP